MNLGEGLQIMRKLGKDDKVSKKGLNQQILEKIEQDIRETLHTYE